MHVKWYATNSVQYANKAVKPYTSLHTNKPTNQLPEQLQTNGESNTPFQGTVEPQFTNASHHKPIGSQTNFPNK
jgi:hypothetical protein